MALKDILDAEIKKTLSSEEQDFYDLDALIEEERRKSQSDFGRKAFKIIEVTIEKIDKASIDELQLRLTRLNNLKKYTKEAEVGDIEEQLVLSAIAEAEKALTKQLKNRKAFFTKTKKLISQNTIDVGALLIGMAAGDPLVAFGVKIVGDMMRARKERKLEAEQDEKDTIREDAESLKPKVKGGIGDKGGKGGIWDDDDDWGSPYGGGYSGSGGPLTRAPMNYESSSPESFGLGGGNAGDGSGAKNHGAVMNILQDIFLFTEEISDDVKQLVTIAREKNKFDDLEASREAGGVGEGLVRSKDANTKEQKGGIFNTIASFLGGRAVLGGIGSILGGAAAAGSLLLMVGKYGLIAGVAAAVLYGAYDIISTYLEGKGEKSGSQQLIEKMLDTAFGADASFDSPSPYQRGLAVINDKMSDIADSWASFWDGQAEIAIRTIHDPVERNQMAQDLAAKRNTRERQSDLRTLDRALAEGRPPSNSESIEKNRLAKLAQLTSDQITRTGLFSGTTIPSFLGGGAAVAESDEIYRQESEKINAEAADHQNKNTIMDMRKLIGHSTSRPQQGNQQKDPVGTLSPEALDKVHKISARLQIKPEWLIQSMAFETGGTFSPSEKNRAGSSGTGMIQFMDKTARDLGTTTEKLSKMSQVEQLDYVEAYFNPFKGKMHSGADVYQAILAGRVEGGLDDSVFANKNQAENYEANKGLDKDGSGVISKEEAYATGPGRYASHAAKLTQTTAMTTALTGAAAPELTGGLLAVIAATVAAALAQQSDKGSTTNVINSGNTNVVSSGGGKGGGPQTGGGPIPTNTARGNSALLAQA